MTKQQMNEALDQISAEMTNFEGTDLDFAIAHADALEALEALDPTLYQEVVAERLEAWQQANSHSGGRS